MKRLLLLLFLSSLAVNAQLRERGTVEIIPEIGFTTAFMRGNDVYNNLYDNNFVLPSTNYGVAGDYYFNNRWSLRSGLLFQTMGSYTIEKDTEKRLNYLNIPVNANWHFGSTRKWNLNFGLIPSFLMSAKDNSIDVKNQFKSSQLGLSHGLGYKLEVSKEFSLLFDAQVFYGMSNVSKGDYNLYNNAVSFNLGGVFHFK